MAGLHLNLPPIEKSEKCPAGWVSCFVIGQHVRPLLVLNRSNLLRPYPLHSSLLIISLDNPLLFVYDLDIMPPLDLPRSTPPPRRLGALCVSALAPSSRHCRLSQDHGPRLTQSFFSIFTRHSSLATRHCLLTPLESALTSCDALSPLDSALTQTTGGGGLPLLDKTPRSYLKVSLSPLDATLTSHPTSVDFKELTGMLNPLDATLTKSRGGDVEQFVFVRLHAREVARTGLIE
jgi:hypothetical protein